MGSFSYSKGLRSLIRRHFTASGVTASESAAKSVQRGQFHLPSQVDQILWFGVIRKLF